MLRSFVEWLATSHFSKTLQSLFWIIPTLQLFHILALAIVMASVWILYLRVMGIAGLAHSIDAMARRFLPWIWGALVIMAISGSLLIVAEPRDSLLKPVLQLKLLLLACAIVLTVFFQHGVRHRVYAGDALVSTPKIGTKILGGLSLLLWVSIAIAGRLIAYI